MQKNSFSKTCFVVMQNMLFKEHIPVSLFPINVSTVSAHYEAAYLVFDAMQVLYWLGVE